MKKNSKNKSNIYKTDDISKYSKTINLNSSLESLIIDILNIIFGGEKRRIISIHKKTKGALSAFWHKGIIIL